MVQLKDVVNREDCYGIKITNMFWEYKSHLFDFVAIIVEVLYHLFSCFSFIIVRRHLYTFCWHYIHRHIKASLHYPKMIKYITNKLVRFLQLCLVLPMQFVIARACNSQTNHKLEINYNFNGNGTGNVTGKSFEF